MSFGPFPNDPGLGSSVAFGLAANAPAAGTVPAGYQYVATDTDTVTYYSKTSSYTIGSGGGQGTPTLIRTTSVAGPDGTTPAIDTTGCDLLVQVGAQNAPTDSRGNAWVVATPAGQQPTIWYVRDPLTSPTHTFTSNQNSIAVAAFANADGAKNISNQNNYTPAGIQGTTIYPNELVIVGWQGASGGTGPSAVTYAGFTQDVFIPASSVNTSIGLYHQVVANSGTVINENPVITGGVNGDSGGSAMCSFLP
jgi:hypothetical protein